MKELENMARRRRRRRRRKRIPHPYSSESTVDDVRTSFASFSSNSAFRTFVFFFFVTAHARSVVPLLSSLLRRMNRNCAT